MQITVLSGKGGTGKTTVATNMALSLPGVQFIDADVEEPNSAIFLRPEFSEEKKIIRRNIPEIDHDKCSGCRECIDFCEYNALALLGEKLYVYPELCGSCGGCKIICPEDAISDQKREVGKIKRGEIKARDNYDSMEFWQGEMTIGEASAVPLIEELKEEIDEEKTVIIDAPPGASCPVIESAVDSDFILLVTEPTPFGLHDLKIAVELVEKLDIPYGVIINRSDPGGDGMIEEYCQSNHIEILLKIPFSRKIAALYSRGKPFVEEMVEWRDNFVNLLADIEVMMA